MSDVALKSMNLVSKIEDKKLVKDYGITEAFFYEGEFYITSEYDLHPDTCNLIECELKKYINH